MLSKTSQFINGMKLRRLRGVWSILEPGLKVTHIYTSCLVKNHCNLQFLMVLVKKTALQ